MGLAQELERKIEWLQKAEVTRLRPNMNEYNFKTRCGLLMLNNGPRREEGKHGYSLCNCGNRECGTSVLISRNPSKVIQL